MTAGTRYRWFPARPLKSLSVGSAQRSMWSERRTPSSFRFSTEHSWVFTVYSANNCGRIRSQCVSFSAESQNVTQELPVPGRTDKTLVRAPLQSEISREVSGQTQSCCGQRYSSSRWDHQRLPSGTFSVARSQQCNKLRCSRGCAAALVPPLQP